MDDVLGNVTEIQNEEVPIDETSVDEVNTTDPEASEEVDTTDTIDVTDETDTGTDPETPDWIVHLNSINNVTINEFGQQTYKFRRVKDPADEWTDKFEVFLHSDDQPEDASEWYVLNGMLSERYSVVHLETFVDSLSNSIGIVGTPEVRVEPFRSAWVGDLNSSVEIWDDDSAKIIFAMITGTPIEAVENMNTKFSIMVLNSYNGSAKLRLDYSLRTSALISGDTQEFRDYFSLTKFSKKVIHGQNLSNLNADINTMMTSVQATINQLKSISLDDNNLIEQIANTFTVEGKNYLNGIWEGVVPDIRNLFYLAVVASIAIDKHWNLSAYLKSKNILDKAIVNATNTN